MSVPNHPEAGPVRSMTAFARAMQHGPFGQLSVELRSVNSRHLELTLRLPDVLRDLEHSWRERLRQQIGRGKVELTLRLDAGDSLADGVVLDQERVRQLLQAAHEIEDLARHVGPVDPVALLRLPGVLRTQEADATALTATAEALLTQALADFLAMRAREGCALTALVEQRLQGVAREVSAVQDRLPGILAHYRERLLERIREAKAELAAERVEQEVVLFAQKLDVAEELDRVLAHLAEIRRVLTGGGAIGRRLDFLMQELNREANTLGSKAVTADSAWSSVELKVLIEQMREQIQNIE
ncbi:YicC/YloC family endoribonuclease [Perlucidibaca piscinae]|uniref:YicC/YloC family endoribonuclease n=1 Tax=Perlucidibaca piscinae TaxID=392589 RepID=UPI0003B3555B|nr:YicC/YloC family endoribonuclease [Perlucidibaca piscinae]